MKRKIVNINEALCNGCGSCIPKCVEGALQIVNGKAKIIKETYCDGLGACLGQCPQGAITITEREAPAFSETEVHEYLKTKTATKPAANIPPTAPQKPQWPIKLDLVPPKAPFFENADLLFAADCAPVALKNFHDFMVGKRVIIGCPKFNDARAYAQKLTEIFQQNNIASVTVVHMEVPCCTGLKWAVNKALEGSGKQIPTKEFEVKIGGEIVESKDKPIQKNPETCPGLRDLIQPKPAYIKCHVCGGDLEIWTDEDKTTCPSCGAEWKRPASNAACLEYCQYADKCRGIIESRKH